MSVELVFNKNILPEHRSEIEKYVLPFLWIVPSWCRRLYVNCYSGEEGGCIQTSIRYEYRQATMDFYSQWLIESAADKQNMVIHDLLHIPTSVYVDFAEDAIKRLCPDGDDSKFQSQLVEQSRMMCESMVQDLADSILSNVANN